MIGRPKFPKALERSCWVRLSSASGHGESQRLLVASRHTDLVDGAAELVSTTSARRPVTVVLTAILSVLYSAGLLWFGVQAALVTASGEGNGNFLAAFGMTATTLLALAGTGLLVAGGWQVWRGRFAWTQLVLLIVFLVSVVGNVADFVGGTVSTSSHVVGLTITLASLLPLLLLRTKSARTFAVGVREAPA